MNTLNQSARLMHLPTPDSDPDPVPPPDHAPDTPQPIGGPPNSQPPERLD
ncbi:hypothetical protein QCE63_14780 [Caballeronia sp. LZ065]|nr:hypothetical protein [Caballeronia sp. LZ065]MDR5780685.1 hypothetical protein [Caballeronia sp. LZ065]